MFDNPNESITRMSTILIAYGTQDMALSNNKNSA
jgi:hypothetical protein